MTVTSAAIPSSPRSTFHGVCKPGRSRPVRASRLAPVWERGSGAWAAPEAAGFADGRALGERHRGLGGFGARQSEVARAVSLELLASEHFNCLLL